jgi:hypothetical protein
MLTMTMEGSLSDELNLENCTDVDIYEDSPDEMNVEDALMKR